MKGIVDEVMVSGFDGIFLIVFNLVDILIYVIWKFLGFLKECVIGFGISFDIVCFCMLIVDYLKVDVCNVYGYIFGEYGDIGFLVWSYIIVGGFLIIEWISEDE